MTTTAPSPEPKPEGRVGQVSGWLLERAGAMGIWESFFARKVPLGVGWLYTLGFASMFAFTVQAATGIFLAVYYSPSPDHAYDSIQFIMFQVPFGAVVRGFHHWMASVMVVLVILHMATVFVLGAYKYPRELTWMVGVGLLVVTLGFAFTGYLLPWDQKAYWATVVGTNIPGTLPVVGDLILRIMRGGAQLGTLTLTRFYSFHVLLLPASLAALLGAHLYLIVHHGVSVPPWLWDSVAPRVRAVLGHREEAERAATREEAYHRRYEQFKREGHPFWPDVIVQDTLAAAVVLLCTIGLMVTMGVPTEEPADPTNTAYVPRPEWYFMFLFQALKYFPGNLEWVGAAVLPGVVMLAILLLPVYDRGPNRAPWKRPLAMTAGAAMAAIVGYLTYVAYQ
ncbi:MAG TPA: cytochrome b N-terminal domain-containing protein [Chloroflexota bacterium]|nr:cytochrome b N-terminal domain-containing protein [Chloroflexota bacterium]